MHMLRNMVVSTTTTLDGFETKAYLGVVSAHVVTGTNVFSDIFAELSDFFGGRSKSYQKQLSSINDEVIERLKEAAFSLGANCIVGLRIDHDEISGKGKSMFMVTASGTAIIADRARTIDKTPSQTIQISADNLSESIERQFLIDSAINGSLDFRDETWERLCTNQVYEVADSILKTIESPSSQRLSNVSPAFVDRCKIYFRSIPGEEAKKYLYGALSKYGTKTQQFALNLIIERKLLDFDFATELLASDDFKRQKLALIVLTADKSAYCPADADKFAVLSNQVESTFRKRGKTSERVNRFTSKKTRMWICECTEKVEMHFIHCPKCSHDIYGFRSSSTYPSSHPVALVGVLTKKADALRREFAAHQ